MAEALLGMKETEEAKVEEEMANVRTKLADICQDLQAAELSKLERHRCEGLVSATACEALVFVAAKIASLRELIVFDSLSSRR